MVEQLQPPPPANAKSAADVADLSAEIALQVEKEPSDRVSCRRVDENYYRCNWWAPANGKGYDNPWMGGLTVTTHRVRKSQFLRVTKSSDGLIIRVV
ncbi:MAG: hypothetical protein WBD40_04145 [Tepidisphaeraceae bacterium]